MEIRQGTVPTLSPAEVQNLARRAALLRVAGEEKRLRMLYLLTQGELCVCNIMEALDISQALASHHLGVLREAGLVFDRRDARWVYYSLNPAAVSELGRYLERLADAASAHEGVSSDCA
jgi:ArsR family transcriptional regulator